MATVQIPLPYKETNTDADTEHKANHSPTQLISKICLSVIGVYLVAISIFTSNVTHAVPSNNKDSKTPTNIEVQVLNHKGQPLSDIIVELEYVNYPKAASSKTRAAATMDQIDQQFVPHILVIQQGDKVSFPNSDKVKHHVYSFSASKTFEQQLYKGKDAKPINFETSGIVEVGCNIHDWMLGYIYVAQSHTYKLTNESGMASFEYHDTPSKIHAWHPLMQEQNMRISHNIAEFTPGDLLTIKLERPLQESLSDYERLSVDVY